MEHFKKIRDIKPEMAYFFGTNWGTSFPLLKLKLDPYLMQENTKDDNGQTYKVIVGNYVRKQNKNTISKSINEPSC